MNSIQKFYENKYFENLKETQPFRDYLIEEEIKMADSISGGKALDVGCGSGRSTEILSSLCDFVIGIDFSERLLNHAPDLRNVSYYLENAESTRFKDDSFDYVVMCWNTFGNLNSSRDKVLHEAKRVVKPTGKIMLSVFSENVLSDYLDFVYQNGLHVKQMKGDYVFLKEGLVSERFSEEKLNSIFKKTGSQASIEPLTNISYWCEARK